MDTPAVPDFLNITTSLAMELASGLSEPSIVFERHGISEDQAKELLNNPHFQKLVKEAKAEWDADTNISERIKLKAQMALEELLLPTFTLAQDPRVPPPSRTDAVKLFERLSGVGKQSENDFGGGGPKFVLQLNLGKQEDTTTTIEGRVIDDE